MKMTASNLWKNTVKAAEKQDLMRNDAAASLRKNLRRARWHAFKFFSCDCRFEQISSSG
jgi:hypothetical protein